eukprot:scaffold373_cov350-Pavlova_lutheri.AAC.8
MACGAHSCLPGAWYADGCTCVFTHPSPPHPSTFARIHSSRGGGPVWWFLPRATLAVVADVDVDWTRSVSAVPCPWAPPSWGLGFRWGREGGGMRPLEGDTEGGWGGSGRRSPLDSGDISSAGPVHGRANEGDRTPHHRGIKAGARRGSVRIEQGKIGQGRSLASTLGPSSQRKR